MSSAAIPLPEPGWDDEGRRLSPLIDTLSAVVVVGSETAASTLVALGLARAQAERRRVVIGDLVGDLELLESMIPRHDHHGLSDSFNYGISLNRIGYPVESGGNLFIMPSGSEPVATEMIKAGTWVTMPSPMVSRVKVCKAVDQSMPIWATPMIQPANMLISRMMIPATASPFTNFEAPSIEP